MSGITSNIHNNRFDWVDVVQYSGAAAIAAVTVVAIALIFSQASPVGNVIIVSSAVNGGIFGIVVFSSFLKCRQAPPQNRLSSSQITKLSVDVSSQTSETSHSSSESESEEVEYLDPEVEEQALPFIENTTKIESLTPQEKVNKEVLPPIVKALINVIETGIRKDAKLNQTPNVEKRIEQLNNSVEAFVTLFQKIINNPGMRDPAKQTQLLRRILAAWNTEQYGLLEPLFKEFDDRNSKIPREKVKTEADISKFLKKFVFHLGQILHEIEIIFKHDKEKEKLMKEANVTYLMEEAAKELITVTPKARQEFKSMLELQATLNEEKVWNKSWNPYLFFISSQKYMLVKNSDSTNQNHFDEIKKRLKQAGNSDESFNYNDYQAVACTLGPHSTWFLKANIGEKGASAAATIAPLFKGQLIKMIKQALINQSFLSEKETSMDQPLQNFVEAILPMAVNILQNNGGMRDKVLNFLRESAIPKAEEMDLSNTNDVDEILKILGNTFNECQKTLELA